MAWDIDYEEVGLIFVLAQDLLHLVHDGLGLTEVKVEGREDGAVWPELVLFHYLH